MYYAESYTMLSHVLCRIMYYAESCVMLNHVLCRTVMNHEYMQNRVSRWIMNTYESRLMCFMSYAGSCLMLDHVLCWIMSYAES